MRPADAGEYREDRAAFRGEQGALPEAPGAVADELLATTGERSIWNGDLAGEIDMSFNDQVLEFGPPGAGRHGGVTFFASGASACCGVGYTLE